MNAETAVRDTSLAWPWQAAAWIRVAIDAATRPVELLTIHNYWVRAAESSPSGFLVLADVGIW